MKKDSNIYKPFISGKRIYLREVRLSDIDVNYYRWMNDPEVGQFLETRFYPNSQEHIESYVRQMSNDTGSVFMAIVVHDGDYHIGNIKIGPINWIHRFADLSLVIGEKKCWGKGFATEAISLCVQHAFQHLNLHKLNAGVYAKNIASMKAFKKAHFQEEGVKKHHRFYNGAHIDEVIFGIIRPEEENKELL